VYKYGTSGFPNLSFNSSNYWVDVLYKPTTTAAASVTTAAKPTEQAQTIQRLDVKVVPNPTTSFFKLLIQSADRASVEVRVIDALGRTVDTKRGISSNSSLSIGHNYRPGSYYVQVMQGTKKATAKLVKLRQ
jgi:hypothetical protein